MRLTAKLAFSQIKRNRSRSIMTLLGIALSTAMLTAVCGFVASAKAKAAIDSSFGYDYNSDNFNTSIITIGVIFGTIIIIASIIVSSNAFRISANDRIRQFGILKSAGATKKQITVLVLYESVFLSMFGIPIGLIIGLLIDLIGTSIITNLLHTFSSKGLLIIYFEEFLTVPFAAPPLMIGITIVISFGTILISAWLPARKAARIPAIDAIRSTGTVKLKEKNVRTSQLTQALFGFEGTLAAKTMKRNRHSFRATVISMTISIVLLIAAESFGTMMKLNSMNINIDAAGATIINDMINIIMFFVYIFIGMLTLIAITSVISTINTNIRSRAREFAVLESVGMTKSEIKKMLNLESVLCSIRSLLFGLPIGIAAAYSLYWGIEFSDEVTFSFPWFSVIKCVFGIMALAWITMRYSVSRLKDGSIVETIRGE